MGTCAIQCREVDQKGYSKFMKKWLHVNANVHNESFGSYDEPLNKGLNLIIKESHKVNKTSVKSSFKKSVEIFIETEKEELF